MRSIASVNSPLRGAAEQRARKRRGGRDAVALPRAMRFIAAAGEAIGRFNCPTAPPVEQEEHCV